MPASNLERLLLRPTRSAVIAHLVLLIASGYWHYKVSAIVPEPYLDEVFHVRQAEAYWRGQWHVWDPKITTPPGLYIISYVHLHILNVAGRLSNITSGLRSINSIAANVLIFVLVRSLLRKIRHLSESDRTPGLRRTKQLLRWSEAELDHTTLNICLFSPLFFFYGLYYTDVLSAGSVLLTYYFFLHRQTTGLLLAGLSSLLFRQTNIFWVAIFLGGLEVVRSLGRPVTHPPAWTEVLGGFSEKIRFYDPLVSEACFEDYVKSACSIAICTLVNLRSVLRRLMPYLAFIGAFGAFLVWNGGVVLGDKDNHIASLHLTQMLYIWPYIFFFSFPLLHQSILQAIIPSQYLPKPLRSPYPIQSLPRLIITLPITATMLAIVHFNTLIHPFTLADNRHYIFYIFRLLLLHPALRYLAVPIYYLCAWAALTALSGPPDLRFSQEASASITKRAVNPSAQVSPPEGNRVNFVLVWLAATTLSLVTAPLVEPRYFILPWLMWRLQIPSRGPLLQDHPGRQSSNRRLRSLGARAKAVLYEEHDYRLWLETVWFLAVDWGTGYVFLYWGFGWKQEPGRVQRFMW